MKKDDAIVVCEATLDEIDEVLGFIKRHYYIPNHVYTRRRDLFLEHHVVDDKLCFIVAIDEESGSICGIAGYFPSSRVERPDLFISMLQTVNTGNALVGISMVQEAQKCTKARALISSGVVKKILPIYKFMGFETGKLKHYYRYSEQIEHFVIASIRARLPQPYSGGNARLVLFKSMQDVEANFDFHAFKDHVPYKDARFVSDKYFGNIGYDYKVYGAYDADSCCALLVGRDAVANDAVAFKIIDFIGESSCLASLGASIDGLLVAGGYEYVDFYEYGIPDETMRQAGFIELDESDPNIIPHYFEPFEQRNIDIHFFTSMRDNCTVFRADGGQDRPNFLD